MENKSHALIAGLFILALGVGLALLALWFDRDTRERKPYELVTQASVAGLSPESAVRYRGLSVGRVEDIRFDPAVPGQILVRIAVETGTPITHSTFATLGYQGVTGLAYVQFDDNGTAPTPLQTSPSRVARINIRPGLIDKLAGSSEGLMLQVNEISVRLNKLLAPENQNILMHTVASMDETITRLGRLPGILEPTLASLPPFIADTRKTLGSVNGMAQNFDALATRLQGSGGALERINSSLDHLDVTAGVIATSASGLDAMTSSMNNDTLPRMSHLADELGHTARGIDLAIENLGENPQSLIAGETKIQPGPGEQGYRRE